MYQNTVIIGNLGADPEQRATNSGKAVTNFRVATSSGFGEKEKTEWFNVVAWEKTAEAVGKFLKKGSKVFVSGRLETRQYEDKNGGTRYMTELIAHEVKFLDSKPKATTADDDLPF